MNTAIHVNQMLDDPSYISHGRLCFARDKLGIKIRAASIENSIVVALDHLKAERSKTLFSGRSKVEMAMKELFTGKDVNGHA